MEVTRALGCCALRLAAKLAVGLSSAWVSAHPHLKTWDQAFHSDAVLKLYCFHCLEQEAVQHAVVTCFQTPASGVVDLYLRPGAVAVKQLVEQQVQMQQGNSAPFEAAADGAGPQVVKHCLLG